VSVITREITLSDVNSHYFALLCQLSGTPDQQDRPHPETTVGWLRYAENNDHVIFVCEDEEYAGPLCPKIIGTASVLIEHKFLHHGSRVGHIEDVVVSSEFRGMGIGGELIQACVALCESRDCYKVILDCSKENVPFYEVCGFGDAGHCMRMDLINGEP